MQMGVCVCFGRCADVCGVVMKWMVIMYAFRFTGKHRWFENRQGLQNSICAQLYSTSARQLRTTPSAIRKTTTATLILNRP